MQSMLQGYLIKLLELIPDTGNVYTEKQCIWNNQDIVSDDDIIYFMLTCSKLIIIVTKTCFVCITQVHWKAHLVKVNVFQCKILSIELR